MGIIWASPNTILGLSLGSIGLLTGGQSRIKDCVIEFHGGFVTWWITNLPWNPYVSAMTLGHTILGRSEACLDISHQHELVHVRQYEIWGPFMLPAYLGSSFYLWLNGKRPYYDNPFEKEAYEKEDV